MQRRDLKRLSRLSPHPLVRYHARRLARAALRRLLAMLAPLLLPLAPLLLVLGLAVLLFAAVYGAMPGEQCLTGVEPDERDRVYRDHAKQVVAEYNVKETWLVPGEGSWYPRQGRERLGFLADRYGQDVKLINQWGDAYSPALYRALQTGGEDKMQDRGWVKNAIKEAAEELRPWFYYKESKVISCGKDGCTETTVYLLVEAYTIRGHFRYHYRWVEKNGSRYEELASIETISDGREYLEKYLARALGLKEKSEDVKLAGDMVFNASIAFTQARKEWLAWLDRVFGGAYAWASGAAIPAEYRGFLEEAEHMTGIPAWLLAGLIQVESSWDPWAVSSAGCFGLTQINPAYWPSWAAQLGFDPERDKWNPRAQIITGAYILKTYLPGTVDWDHFDTDPNLRLALARYNAGPGGKLDSREVQEYIEKVISAAKGYRTPAVWPVKGTSRADISSLFGWRIDPVFGTRAFHAGIDIAIPEGREVLSVSAGTCWTGYDPERGNYVEVKDGTYEYHYYHLSAVLVSTGQAVRPGDVIGLVGSTGKSTGPHLHFGVRRLDTDTWIDPLLILE